MYFKSVFVESTHTHQLIYLLFILILLADLNLHFAEKRPMLAAIMKIKTSATKKMFSIGLKIDEKDEKSNHEGKTKYIFDVK